MNFEDFAEYIAFSVGISGVKLNYNAIAKELGKEKAEEIRSQVESVLELKKKMGV